MSKNIIPAQKTATEQKKSYISSLIMLVVLAVCIILAIFAWFTVNSRIAKFSGVSLYAVDDLDIRYNTYEGTVQNNNKVTYNRNVDWNTDFEKLGEEIPAITIFPGERKYFMTIVSNYETSAVKGDLCLEDFLINKDLVSTQNKIYVNFGSQLEGSNVQQAYDMDTVSYSYSNVYSLISLQTFYADITLPAATVEDGEIVPTPVTVYWYVTLNGAMSDNNLMGKEFMKFSSIRLKVDKSATTTTNNA